MMTVYAIRSTELSEKFPLHHGGIPYAEKNHIPTEGTAFFQVGAI
jgi:hypothetical protein